MRLAEGPTGGQWQEWPRVLVCGFCHGTGVKTIYIVKFGLCLRHATAAEVSQWAWGSPADGPKSANPSWSRAELLLSSPGCPCQHHAVLPGAGARLLPGFCAPEATGASFTA